jgi:hypothetical protein
MQADPRMTGMLHCLVIVSICRVFLLDYGLHLIENVGEMGEVHAHQSLLSRMPSEVFPVPQ